MSIEPINHLPEIPNTRLRSPTEAWLSSKAPATQDVYRRDLKAWIAFCISRGIDPLRARKPDADLFGAYLQESGENRAPLSAPSAYRRMAAASSWYSYLIACDLLERNPFAAAQRPKVDRDFSATPWLSLEQARLLIEAAERWRDPHKLRNTAILRVLIELGLRVSEVARLRHEDLLVLDGKRALLIHAKGGKRLHRALSDSTAEALDAYLAWRAAQLGVQPGELEGPLFVNNKGNALTRDTLARIVQGVAALTAIPVNITPHVLRHSFATIATEEGADLDDLQSAMGHADPRTTRRYQRAASRLEHDPAHLVSKALG